MERIALTVPVKIKYLHLVSQFGVRAADSIEHPGGPNGESGFAHSFELALSEAFTNAVKHSQGSRALSKIIIEFEIEEDALSISVKDRNPRFDPDVAPPADIGTCPVGGYGLFLMKQVMDKVAYRREDGWNVMTMSKKVRELL